MEKNILKEYNTKVQQLSAAFKDLTNNNLVPITHGEKSYTIESVKEVQDNLKKQEFTISVCGQINAGKSSFLNYLLFNDKEVLPADDTPWTAKLTTVRYGEENSATVTYYSSEEWESLKNQEKVNDEGITSSYYDEFLKKDVNASALKGLHVDSFITSINKTVDGISLNELKEYVSKGRDMTPFVKQVDIKVNNELAKGVVFVDTPGINDKNELRSKVTEDWIKKSCAVIYLFYAGQALSTADYEFIDKHLSSVPTDKILFALTKADVSEDYEGAKSFVEKTLKEDEELKKRKFITDNKSVYPISTMSALINYKQLNNIMLNEDDEFHLERIMEESPLFIKNNGFIEEFVKGLKSHLMTQTGKAILDKTTAFLYDIYKTNEASLRSDINTTKDKLESLNLSDEELKEKIAKWNKLIDEIENFKKQFERNILKEKVAIIKSNLNRELIKLRTKGFNSLNETLEDASSESIKNLRSIAIHLTKQSLVDISKEIYNLVLIELSIKEDVNDLLETFSNNFENIISDVNVYEGSLSCVIDDPSPLVKNINYNQLSVEKLKETCGLFYWGIFKVKLVRSKILTEIRMIYESHIDYLIDNVLNNIDNIIEKNMNGVYNNVNTEVKKIKSSSNDVLASSKGNDEQKNIFQGEIVSAQERLDYVLFHFKTLQKCL